MADVYDTSSLNQITKDRFASSIKDRIPEARKFFSRLSMLENGQLGKRYQQPIETQLPQGMTYAAPNSGPFDIEDMEPGALETAEVESNQFLFADAISYEEEARAKAKGEGAYTSAVGRVIKRAMRSFTKRVELSFLYGHSTLGIIESAPLAVGPDGDGLYTRDLVIYAREWASGIWLGMKKARLEIRNVTNNANGAQYAGATKRNAGVVKIAKVNVNTRTVTVRGSQADLTAIALNDCIVFAGTYGKETMGLHRIASNEGVIYGLDAAEFDEQLAGNVYDVGGVELTLRRLYEGQSFAVAKGLEDTDVAMFLNPLTFANLLANEVALRRYYELQNGDVKTGLKNLRFQGQHGMIEFIPYICIKQGEAICGPLDTMAKVGAQDITMQPPGREPGQFWKAIEKKAGYEMRLYANLGLFSDVPAYWTVYRNIVNAL